MSVPNPNFNPPFNIIRCSYVVLGSQNIEASKHFYRDTLGLYLDHEEKNRLLLRAMEERNSSVLLENETGEASYCHALGFLVVEEDLEKVEAWFNKEGLSAKWTSRHGLSERILQVKDPNGMILEFCGKMEKRERITQKYGLYKGVHPLRIDHFNAFSPDVQASVDFYNSIGFRLTEYTETDPSDQEPPTLWAAWMHRKGGVHDIAFTNGVGPRMHHVAFWVPNPLNIIHLCDVMSTTGYLTNIERGPGRHGISNAFFLYIRDPDGHRVELYCSDYLTVDHDLKPIRWSLTDTQRQTLWGSPAPRSWFEEGSLFPNTPVQEARLKAKPIIAH